MHQSYPDIVALTKNPPTWWDENGVPRYAPHHPWLCADIYADEVALLRISCQACDHEFLVQMSRGSSEQFRHHLLTHPSPEVSKLLEEALAGWESLWRSDNNDEPPARIAAIRAEVAAMRATPYRSLADLVRSGSIHYGDPPDVDCCPAGATMNCNDLAVVEFWKRGWDQSRSAEGVPLKEIMDEMNGWRRVPELEIAIPQADSDG
jgi:hypothetical protein